MLFIILTLGEQQILRRSLPAHEPDLRDVISVVGDDLSPRLHPEDLDHHLVVPPAAGDVVAEDVDGEDLGAVDVPPRLPDLHGGEVDDGDGAVEEAAVEEEVAVAPGHYWHHRFSVQPGFEEAFESLFGTKHTYLSWPIPYFPVRETVSPSLFRVLGCPRQVE